MAEPNGYIQGTDGKPLALVDITARRQLAGKLDAPGGVKPGDYLIVKSVGEDGTVVLEGAGVPGTGSGQNVNQMDVFGGYDRFYDSIARMQVNPTAPLDIQTYDGSNKPTHPKVLYFADGWAGHKYWLTYSPFPNNNNTYENPCIEYSDDGVNFTGAGIANPIEDTPMENGVKVGYNSDPHLVLVNGVMECWWRTHFQSGTNANHEVIFRKTSTDGINWSAKEELFRVQDASAGSCLSPAVIFESGIYKIWTVRKQQVMRYYESTTGADWQHIRDINVDNPDYPTYKVWHIDVIHSDKGYEFVGCYHPTGDYNDNRYIYYAVSQDNITYSNRVLILTPGKAGSFDATELYRPAILRLNNKVRIYYGCRNGGGNWRIGMIEAPTPYLFNAVLRNGLRFDALESRLSTLESGSGGSGGTVTTRTITYKLTNCTSSNGATSVSDGASYTAKLSTSTGYTLGTPTITMGGVDITATAWNGAAATITIASVSGDITIACSATADSGGDDTQPDLDLTVVDNWSDSAWTAGYVNDDGELTEELNMHHSQLMTTGDATKKITVKSNIGVSNHYLRISYFDANKTYIGWDRGNGLNASINASASAIIVDHDNGAYFCVNLNSANKSDVSVINSDSKGDFVTNHTPVAVYSGESHGDTDGEWAEKNGGDSITMHGGTWENGVLALDGVDDKLVVPLTNAKSVVMRIKPMESYVNDNTGYIFDCRTTASAYMLNYNKADYIGAAAMVYLGTTPFEKSATGYAALVVEGNWYNWTIVFNAPFSGNMIVGASNNDNDYMACEIEEIKVYDADITAG